MATNPSAVPQTGSQTGKLIGVCSAGIAICTLVLVLRCISRRRVGFWWDDWVCNLAHWTMSAMLMMAIVHHDRICKSCSRGPKIQESYTNIKPITVACNAIQMARKFRPILRAAQTLASDDSLVIPHGFGHHSESMAVLDNFNHFAYVYLNFARIIDLRIKQIFHGSNLQPRNRRCKDVCTIHVPSNLSFGLRAKKRIHPHGVGHHVGNRD